MGKLEVKVIIRRCVSRWAGQKANQQNKLEQLNNITAATRRRLAEEINGHSDLAECAPVIVDDQIEGGLRVTELGNIVWDNKPDCLEELS